MQVLFLRHKLQKGFLSRDQAPQENEMPQMSGYIKKLEEHADLEVSIIRTTKINKVLKALIKLNTIPKDEEFKFRERSVKLLEKWNKLLGSENVGEGEASAEMEDKPTTNGVHKEKPEDRGDLETPVEGSAVAIEAASVEDQTDHPTLPSVNDTQKPEDDTQEEVDASA